MNFLIIDDNEIKLKRLCDSVGERDNIVTANNLCESLAKIKDNPESFDCIITDMQFPVRSNDLNIDPKAGLRIPIFAKRYGFKGKIILCTSADKGELSDLKAINDFDYVIHYNYCVSLTSDFEEIYKIIKTK